MAESPYRALKRQFAVDDAFLDDLRYELTDVQGCAIDYDRTILVWTGNPGTTAPRLSPAAPAAVALP